MRCFLAYSGFDFNPRTLKGYDKQAQMDYRTECTFQSTYPQGVRHSAYNITAAIFPISIHVPSRGTTQLIFLIIGGLIYFNPRTLKGYDAFFGEGFELGIISIHVPSRGTTCHRVSGTPASIFQSTYPQGVRLARLV